jgi:hypothetical protein
MLIKNVADVDAMDPNRMKKILVVDCEDVVDDGEEISMELDENNDLVSVLNDLHCLVD